MILKSIHVLAVPDLDASCRFYGDVLSFEPYRWAIQDGACYFATSAGSW
jgi:catechol 2,3-dioxygenase-like lactoylglutathione lyase family enzyme